MPNHFFLASEPQRTAFAFRGYNTENLGRTAELLAAPRYRSTVRGRLQQASLVCSDVLKRPVDLVKRVELGREASLADYAESVALVFAVELAQIDLLRELCGVDVADARLVYGYSLGELVALVACGRLVDEQALRLPLAMATDCAELADDVTMGVLFSRGPAIEEHRVLDVCERLTAEGRGVIGVSAVLSPNTYLVLGQGDTVPRLKRGLADFFPHAVHLRRNDSRWPPLHTPIVRQRNVPDRAAVMMQTLKIARPGHGRANGSPLFSLVTGKPLAAGKPIRETLRDWVDHPQRLWDAVCATLAADVTTVVHVGPAPNVIPATFRRLSDNVRQQTTGASLAAWGRLAASQVQRTWLASLLPKSASLLRAPDVKHVVLEDWLLDQV